MKIGQIFNRCTPLRLSLGLAVAGVLFSMACNSAPPPQPLGEVPATGAAASRASASTSRKALVREQGIQAVEAVSIPQPEGKQFKFADLKGKVLVVDFWATWCPPCRKQAPKLAALNSRYRDSGLAVIGLTADEPKDESAVLNFVKQAGINYTIGYANSSLSSKF
ncbi:MAG TPA: TlpA disulfide reductase family protein, partial [Blastocatellia bacterium]|nr:TlpA disulfide reductase family protein [Blastocatellia bacterium]